jgi:hypothetical protein
MSLTHDVRPPTLLSTDSETRDALAAAARDRAARNVRGLAELLTLRPELRGVHAPADFAADAIRWSA